MKMMDRTRPQIIRDWSRTSRFAVALTIGIVLALPSGATRSDDSDASALPHLVPASILRLPESIDKVVLVDVSEYRMYEIRRRGDSVSVDKNFYVAIGKQGADKRYEGDEKTPVGAYTIQTHIPGSRLPEIYGDGALPMDYPSAWDKFLGRTGSGIWIHGTNKSDDELLPRSSRGCLTLRNSDFATILEDVDLGSTPVLVSHQIDWQSEQEVAASRAEIEARLEAWRQDWESRDTNRYLSHYHPDFRSGNMDLDRWKRHKRRVNASKTRISVALDDISIFRYPGEDDLVEVRFRQFYDSNNYRGEREKRQYWKRTEDGWKIILEAS